MYLDDAGQVYGFFAAIATLIVVTLAVGIAVARRR